MKRIKRSDAIIRLRRTGDGIEASIKLFCLAFGFGYAWNSAVSEGAKWAEKRK